MKNVVRGIAIAVTSAMLAFGASAASATDFTVPLKASSGVYTGGFNDTVSGSFADAITFTIPTLGGNGAFTLSSGSITASSVITGLSGYLDNPSQSFTIFQSGSSPTVTDFGFLNVGSLTSGNHTIFLSGVTGTASIAGTITIAAATAAVPEPASWALMIGGVGIAGGALRRRAKRDRGNLAAA
jgi:hypothetical protein